MNDQRTDTINRSQKERLISLRAHLEAAGVDGCLVPRGDEYQNEFVASYAERLAWLTGFTGSAGLAIVLREQAALFVDGRYTLQVTDQVDSSLYDLRHIVDEPATTWLVETLGPGQRIGFDPHLHTPAQVQKIKEACQKIGSELVSLDINPIDAIWVDQPLHPRSIVKTHPHVLSGQTHKEKRDLIAKALRKEGYSAFLITAPDSLCWLLNIRGADVENTPLVLASALLCADGKVTLFIDPDRLTDEVYQHLGNEIQIARADGLGAAVDEFDEGLKAIAVDQTTVSQWAVDRLKVADFSVAEIHDPCSIPKACKNETELAGMRKAHVRDGAALTRFLAWLDQHASKGDLTEVSAADQLEKFRSVEAMYQGLSFPTISGAGANSAIVHYRATRETDAPIAGDILYLVDSGGQYLDGTTDVTRTVAVGNPTVEQKRRFTQVLKGHIAIASARFPEGTSGGQLDAFARAALWVDGVDYDHGTGHGVGAYLGVHEGPQRISKAGPGPALKRGMVVSNEPGYYKPDGFGIRIENLVVVCEQIAPEGSEKSLYGFETITLAPIDLRLIADELLNSDEKVWLNNYHSRVRDTLSPLIEDHYSSWLTEATRPI